MANNPPAAKNDSERPPNAMVGSLATNIEIVSLICGFLDTSTLASFARTARIFTEPSLNSLWKEQKDLVPLFQCFPPDLWSRGPTVKKEVNVAWEVLTFRRPLGQNDWPRFNFYAHRIRKLEGVHPSRNQRRCDIHANVIAELMAYRPVRTFFPNLQTIVYSRSWIMDVAATPFGQFLLGPCLTEVNIAVSDLPEHGDQGSSSLEMMCVSLQRLCPNIKSLSFYDLEQAPIRAMPAVYQLIRSQNHLEMLCMKSATPSEELLSHLSKIPVLHTLVFVRIPSTHMQFYTTRDGQFPCLHTFVFEAPNWIHAALVVTAMQRSFRSLSIRTLDTEPVSALGSFVDSLKWHPALKTLVYLNVTARRLHLGTPPDPLQVPHALRVLFFCSTLQQLQLHSPAFQDLDDVWLEGAANAWPALTALTITVAPAQTASRITLKGLVPLIKTCPLLTTLRLPLLAIPVDLKNLDGARNYAVTKLALEHSVITLPGLVFRTLIVMFPNLSGIEYMYTEKDNGLQGQAYIAWKAVDELLRATITGSG
ncbi:hypothetical protein BDZ94DRAFT_1322273 [Collybia nuda]|uniref:F-box domain-containing protein n=1 Tax=Collybia nuda TaxID=64659 RepID=A0A9P5Y5U9_9AGAR|nr:hypothetical protein BDZ94DRAFT_1322273 [Collybia nuda]